MGEDFQCLDCCISTRDAPRSARLYAAPLRPLCPQVRITYLRVGSCHSLAPAMSGIFVHEDGRRANTLVHLA